jgi:hypothetical protein
MEEIVKQDIIKVLDKTIHSLENKNVSSLSSISNEVIHNVSIFQDVHSTSIAVLVYALSQILDKTTHINPNIIKELKRAKSALNENNEKIFTQKIRRISLLIEKEDHKLHNYFRHVMDSAKINKGTKLYDHGISTNRVAQLLGRSQWEIVSYLGRTSLSDSYGFNDNMARRISFARKLFATKGMKK